MGDAEIPNTNMIVGYSIPPALLVDMSRVEIKALLLLLERTDNGQHPAAISIKEFDRAAGLSAASVSRAITGLEARGLVQVERVKMVGNGTSGHMTNTYILNRAALNPPTSVSNSYAKTLVGSKPAQTRSLVTMQKVAAIVKQRPGYPEARIYAGERLSSRDLAMRLNDLDKENAQPSAAPKLIADNQLIARYLEAALGIEEKQRSAEKVAALREQAQGINKDQR